MLKPLIGITTNSGWVNTYGALSRHVSAMTIGNIQPIVDNGGIPVLITNVALSADIEEMVSRLDGILFPGGQDIHPSLYGEEMTVNYSDEAKSSGEPYFRPRMMAPDINRDKFEIKVFEAALKQNKPIFGICRGMQLINTCLGGTLHQEVTEIATLQHDVDHTGYSHHHDIDIRSGSVFEKCFDAKSCVGPSTHHQSIKKLGKDLIISGTATDGVIEFIEYEPDDKFVIGVQGDIERSRRNYEGFDKIYQRFVQECALRK